MDTLLRACEREPSPAAPATVLPKNPYQPLRWIHLWDKRKREGPREPGEAWSPCGCRCQSEIWRSTREHFAPTASPHPRIDAGPPTCQMTSGREAGPQRMGAAVPLSILQLQRVDEKSKSAVTKPGSLPTALC